MRDVPLFKTLAKMSHYEKDYWAGYSSSDSDRPLTYRSLHLMRKSLKMIDELSAEIKALKEKMSAQTASLMAAIAEAKVFSQQNGGGEIGQKIIDSIETAIQK